MCLENSTCDHNFLCKGRIIAPKKAQVVQQQKLKKVRIGFKKSVYFPVQLLRPKFNTEYISDDLNLKTPPLLYPKGSRGCNQEQDRAGGDTEGKLKPTQATECGERV